MKIKSENISYLENKKIKNKPIKSNFVNSYMPVVFANMQNGSDLWMTPEYAVMIIIPYLKKFKKNIIWLPFDDENSNFYKILKANGFNVVFSNINKEQDFFTYEPEKWDLIVSNPPWSKKDKVLKRCYSFQKPFALILPIHAISGKYRWKLFSENKLEILCSRNRICFDHKTNNNSKDGNNRPPFESGYFCYKILDEQICWSKE